jgi:demethylmenaquinone methyltransferase / 2-methoxy-6-polyprenyl-1,4-benzoquinol methylase
MFDGLASGYDRFNAWASLGMDRRWRRAFVARIPAGARVLDIATGTGDVAFLAADGGHEVVGLDFSERMLAKAREKDTAQRIQWISASADRLPFTDGSFGSVTSAFALRNLRSCLTDVFAENFRVLNAGGRVLHMDFGRPSGLLQWGHSLHMQFAIPFIGRKVCGESWPEGYLETTIADFYAPVEVKEMLKNVGFAEVVNHPLLWGTVQIYEGKKASC